MSRLLCLGASIATLFGHAATARADADEASLHLQMLAGVAKVADPVDSSNAQSATVAGGSVRATIALRDWLAWEVEGYALGASSMAHRAVVIEETARDVERGVSTFGLEVGATGRFGVQIVPTISLALGPQLRYFGTTPATEPNTNLATGVVDKAADLDVAARASLGLDLRLHPRWMVGLRTSARQALGLSGSRWQSLEGAVWVGYYWYPGIWSF